MDLDRARRMGLELLAEHGLDGWTLRFDRAKRRAGVCRYDDRVIGLSAPLTQLHDVAEVRDTVLHEIAHAIAGPRAAHGPRWRSAALAIGCSARRCVAADAPRVPGAWVGTCRAGHVAQRHRRPQRVVSCAQCSRRFAVEHLLTWTHHGRTVEMDPRYVAELARLTSPGR